MWFSTETLAKGHGETRLADSGLTLEQDDLTFVGLGLSPAIDQQCEFPVTADQRQNGRVTGLEAVVATHFAEHPKRLSRPGKTFDRPQSDAFKLELAP